MTKILLVRPTSALKHLTAASHAHIPLNLLYFISHLEKKGHKVDLLDYEACPFDPEALKKRLERIKYDLAGISAMTATVNFADRIAGIIKSESPGTVTILGGYHADAIPCESKKEFRNFDLVAFGESENTLLEVADQAVSGRDWSRIDGIAHENCEKIVVNKPRTLIPDINTLRYPAYEHINFDNYKGGISPGIPADNAAEMIMSRGCPYKCSFCAVHNTFGYRTRFRTAENIAGEVELLKKYKIKHIYFVDSNFTINRKLCYELLSYLKNLKVTWNCATRVDCVDPGLLKAMKDSGCIKIAYGVEAGSPRVRTLINKNITNEQIIDTFRWTRRLNILTSAFFVVAADPSETPEETEMTWRISRKIKPDFCAFAIITPYPGTEVFEKMKRKNYLTKMNWEGYCHHDPKITWRTDYYSPSDLIRIKKKFDRRHYLSFRFIAKALMSIRSFKDFWYYVKSAKAMFLIGKR